MTPSWSGAAKWWSREASPGLEEVNEDVVYIDGQEVQRIQTREPTVLVEAVPQITRYGTYNPLRRHCGRPGDR